MATKTKLPLGDVPRHLFTVHEYELIGKAGIIHEDERVELIGGEIVEMAPIGDRHASVVARLDDLLRRIPQEGMLWVQNPVTVSGVSQPQPDICVLRRRDDYYSLGKPGPGDVLLTVEVADSSLSYDRRIKLPLYAQSGVPEVWIVNLEADELEVSLEPREGGYSRQLTMKRGDRIAPSAFPEVSFMVDEILG